MTQATPARSAERSLSRAATRLVLTLLAVLAVLAPLTLLTAAVLVERQQARDTATALLAVARARFDVDAAAALGAPAQILVALPLEESGERRRLFDAAGSLWAEQGEAASRLEPVVRIEQPVVLGARALGHLVIERGLRSALGWAALAALLCGAAAWGVWRVALSAPMDALRDAEGRWRSFARRDTLTGLLNREGLRNRLARAIERCRHAERGVGVLLIDVDRFRMINETLGQPAGDQLLLSVAQRIRAVTREGDTLARLGADQFVIQAEAVASAQALAAMARNVLRAADAPFRVAGQDTVAPLSIGIALAGDHADDVDSLLKCADAAMRAAKAGGGARFCVYEPTMEADNRQRLDLDLRLRHALERDEFFLVFQPIVDADGSGIVAVEALLRWADPQRGVISPADFIPVLEQTGLIVPVGRWTMHEACRRGRSWIAQGAHDLVLSVNVSPRQFAEPDFVQTVAAVLEATGLPSGHLQLEVTEGLLLEPTPQTLQKIDALVATGVRLAVDDFGMGYSSLAYLKRFPLHGLKIDRMFVRDLPQARHDAAIVRAIVDLGHGLGLSVTAEGVETANQFHELRRLGCDSMQGYLFARPASAADMTRMLERPGLAGDELGPDSGWSTTSHALLEPL